MERGVELSNPRHVYRALFGVEQVHNRLNEHGTVDKLGELVEKGGKEVEVMSRNLIPQ